MQKEEQVRLAEQFRLLHKGDRVLLLPNAWDAGSARLFSRMGFDAIATTSGGIAWSLGYADGEQSPLDEVIAYVRSMVRVSPLPVTVDFEAGYGAAAADVERSVHAIISAGVAGINIEDGVLHEYLRDTGDAASRIAAARRAADSAGIPIVINARVDCWVTGFGTTSADRISETVQRASAYLEAGADCIYPIGVSDPGEIRELCARIPAPVNIGARAGLKSLAELRKLGVARVSLATRLATIAYSAARDAALDVQVSGGFDSLSATLTYEELQSLFHKH